MELPLVPKKPLAVNPRLLILFGKPKCGKTTALSMLEDNLIIDLEQGSDFVGGLTIKASSTAELVQIKNLLEDAKTKGKTYKYITIDTATALEDIVCDYALKLYKETPFGKNYGSKPGEDHIRKLEKGAGYLYIREAYEKVINMFKNYASECLILVGHVADKMINKDGVEVAEMQLDLTGKLGRILYSRADAIGFMYRQGDKTFINFNGGSDYIVAGRTEHLSNKLFTIMEKTESGEYKTNWNSIFIN